eukprot:12466476-Alexandrium_andersonii.AAC.1
MVTSLRELEDVVAPRARVMVTGRADLRGAVLCPARPAAAPWAAAQCPAGPSTAPVRAAVLAGCVALTGAQPAFANT